MINESRKAIIAFILAFLGPIAAVLTSTDIELTPRVWATAFVLGVIAGLGTYLVPNKPAT